MFARVTPYQLKPGTVEAAMAKAEELKPRIMALPGLLSFTNVANADGSGYIVSVITDQATSDANMEQVKAIWGEMTDFLAAMPVPAGYQHVQHWDN